MIVVNCEISITRRTGWTGTSSTHRGEGEPIMSVIDTVKAKALTAAVMKSYDMLREDLDGNLPKIVKLINSFSGQGDEGQQTTLNSFNMVTTAMADPNSNVHLLAEHIRDNVDPEIARTFIRNFFVNSVTLGMAKQRKVTAEHDCNVPWAILMDPTTACNLHCDGCWAANYEDKRHKSLTFEELDDIICQAKDMGTYIFLYTGGEPLVRKHDLIRLCEKHQDCFFSAFTNGTLVDEKFADDLLRVKNFMPAFSIEGFREATDSRRGNGTFDKVVHAMDLLRERKVPFGASLCYTSQNFDSITSDEFVNFLVEKGVLFAWLFTYMPIGKGAPVELLASAEQRSAMYHIVRDNWRANVPIFFADFWNDGEYTGGCIAAGRRFLHINAGGDAEPCAFIHFSDSNIREKTLLECYESPLFKSYRRHQPFNSNMLRVCPLLDNPGMLSEMVNESGAASTDYMNPETAEELEAKTHDAAERWAVASEPLWELSPKKKLSDECVARGESPTAWVKG